MTANRIRAAMAAALVAALLAGCRGGQTETPGPQPAQPSGSAPSAAAGIPPASRAAKGPHMGTPQAAGPFQVSLTSVPAIPKPGTATFTATVTKGSQPVSGADVTLQLSMVDMGGPKVKLKPAGGVYTGKASLSMAGDWDAKVTVKAGGSTGTAAFVLWVNP